MPELASFALTEARRVNVWVLTNAPSPYQVELLGKVRATQPIELAVRFLRVPDEQVGRLDAVLGTSYRELWGAAPRRWRDEFRLHPRAVREAMFGRFDCYILSGLYTSMTLLACAVVLTIRRKPWAIWLEQPRSEKYRLAWSRDGFLGRILTGLKQSAMRFLLRRSHRVIGMGTAAVNAYRERGASPEKLSMLPYCCDVERYARAEPDAVRQIRERFDLDEKTVFLFSGQMIERKGVDVALRAFAKVAEQRPDVAILLLGDGPLRESYESTVPAELKGRVHFTGFLDQAELPAFFAAADVFVFPSRHDGWGVVVNEACAAGLPVLVSKQTGAALDLVNDNVNGYRLDCEDVDGFAAKMLGFCEHPEQIERFGKKSREIVRRFSTEEGAARFFECVNATMESARMKSMRRQPLESALP